VDVDVAVEVKVVVSVDVMVTKSTVKGCLGYV
jgi:hypothetical protein